MIRPTNGRVVLYTPLKNDAGVATIIQVGEQPLTAHVVHVWGDRLVNLVVFDSLGGAHPMLSVMLLQDDDPAPSHGGFATWMDYQKGQAAKAEAAEKQLAEVRKLASAGSPLI